MTLIKCSECNTKISDKATTCPKCGSPVVALSDRPKRGMSLTIKMIIGIGVAALVMSILQSRDEAEAKKEADKIEAARLATLTPEQREKERLAKIEADKAASEKKIADEKAAAIAAAESKSIGIAEAACQIEAEQRAHDPSSVEWLRHERQFAYTSADKSKAVSVQPLRAKNTMGALTRHTIKCDLKKDGESWSIVRFKEL